MKNNFLKTISVIALSAIFFGTLLFFPACHSATQSKTATIDSTEVAPPRPIKIDTTLKNGIVTDRYDNGVILKKGDYLNGKKEGQWDSWYKSGKPWSENFYTDDLADGKTTVWYENGKTEYTGFFTKGKQSGHWIYYDETGKITQEKNYSN
ncbi:MAG: hypothetical protein ABI199_06960 [Bacteroidia bacterium]